MNRDEHVTNYPVYANQPPEEQSAGVDGNDDVDIPLDVLEKLDLDNQIMENEFAESEVSENELVRNVLSENEHIKGKVKESDLEKSVLTDSELVKSVLAESELVKRVLAESELTEGELAESELVEGVLTDGELVESDHVESEPAESEFATSENAVSKDPGSADLDTLADTSVTSEEVEEAMAVAREAAAAAGVDASYVHEDLTLVSAEAAEMMRTMTWDVRLTALLEDVSEYPEYYVSAVGALSGAALTTIVASAALAAVGTVPVLAQTFEMIGLAYVFWFMNKYLLSPTKRAALSADVRALLRDARTPSSTLLDAARRREMEELNVQATENGQSDDSGREPAQ